MSDHVTPCARPDNDPNDWFIGKDGKQYADDVLVTEADIDAWIDSVDIGKTPTPSERESIRSVLEEPILKARLKARRDAKDACFTECYLRNECLSIALGDNPPTHGTFGGYYEEELKEIRRLRDRRSRARAARLAETSQDADVVAPE